MGKCSFTVRMTPEEAFNMIKGNLSADLVHEEKHEVHGHFVCILVYEKYFMRAGNKVALTVIIEDFGGVTCIRSIGTAGSRDFLFNFDLGASDAFSNEVAEILRSYIIEHN